MAIQLFVPHFEVDECLEEIRTCLEKGWTGLGFKTVEIEEAWKKYTGLPNAHFLNSATSGLHLAVNILKHAHNWQDGDEIISTPLTFVSTNHAILYENMTPVFADVDEHLCLDPLDIEKKITDRTRAVMFVGLGGNTGRLEAVKALCAERGLALILDAAHMAGTRLHGEFPEADVTVFSFQAVKNLPTGDSGMICFADKSLDEEARKKAWLGINKDTFSRTNDKGAYKWMYDVEYTGFKYNGNSIMAAIGLVQLKQLDKHNAYRRQIAAWYRAGFANNPRIKLVPIGPGCESSCHLFQILVNKRDELMLALNREEIYPGVHYRDNRDYRMFAQTVETAPRARYASEHVISLPLHIGLSKSDVDSVIQAVNSHA
ncbi:DegT/DnrJ/EryC1/StrS family aminotransferase [Acetobacter okinawensis]|uniref:DegT/DnrJ/EryC1/StrS family aminotransferase n=1 Tax=Acetobacter okinawensis TaxID=1076594 RepID=UPI000470389D|nr:DegT/DnrJ/EryC1/StrS family aminotransferase [Acetobacter okinawensis]